MSEPTAFDAIDRFALDGRRVLITGAAHGLGLAMATAFAGAGASLYLVDIDTDALEIVAKEIETQAPVATRTADVRDSQDIERAVTELVADGIDVVINDAAVYPTAPLVQMPPEDFLQVLDVNVVGYVRVVRAAHEALVSDGGGRVINLSSITFYLGFPEGLGAYISSKGGVIGLTRALARELGPQGITVNAIAPGAFPTRAEDIIEDRAAYDEQIMASQCIKRRGGVEDIACAALFLAGDGGSFITGQTLAVDGGWVFG